MTEGIDSLEIFFDGVSRSQSEHACNEKKDEDFFFFSQKTWEFFSEPEVFKNGTIGPVVADKLTENQNFVANRIEKDRKKISQAIRRRNYQKYKQT